MTFEQFEPAKMEIIEFEEEDVIATSGGTPTTGGDPIPTRPSDGFGWEEEGENPW